MRKVGMAHLVKAKLFHGQRNWVQTLHYAELAATKLKPLKDRGLETVQVISSALTIKYNALNFMDRNREAMKCAEETYTLWAMNHLRNPGSMTAALALIQSCIHNEEYEDAERYARHAYFMIAEMTDNFIPADQQPRFLADVSYYLATAILNLARAGGIPPAGKQNEGVEAIALARKALELHTQLYGAESAQVAGDMNTLGDALDYFNNVDDDEILRLKEQSIAIISRTEGSSSVNVARNEFNLGHAYNSRADRAHDAKDLDRCMVNLEQASTHFREAARIFRDNNHMDVAGKALHLATGTEENIRRIGIAKAAAAVGTAATRR